jgi:hypothetical protein
MVSFDFSGAALLDVGDEPLKCREFFALENISLARLPTPELLRFFSVVGVGPASLLFLSVEADPLPEVFAPPTAASSAGAMFVGEAVASAGFEGSLLVAPSTVVTSSSLPAPNMRLSRPPPPAWEEKLLLLFPARLKI